VSADSRGEFEDWDNSGSIVTKKNVCSTRTESRINEALMNNPEFHDISKYLVVRASKTVLNGYGLHARQKIFGGYEVGSYQGIEIEKDDIQGDNTYGCQFTGRFLDASKFDSCYWRYANCATSQDEENVCCYVDLEEADFQKRFRYRAYHDDIEEDDELFVSYGPDYWVDSAKSAHPRDNRKLFYSLMAKLEPREDTAVHVDDPDLEAAEEVHFYFV
jgi:hypothetical protein